MNETKERIVRAFQQQLERVGYDRTNLDDIASELRISKKTIYVHFDSKRDIYAAIVDERAAQQKMELAAAVAALATFRERVEAVVSQVLTMAREHMLETDRDEWMREYEVAADGFRQANGELLREFIGAGMAAGEFARGDVVFVERMVATMLLDYVVMVREDPSIDYDDELVKRIIKFLT